MKAQKIKVSIETESLSVDSVRGLLLHVIEQLDKEAQDGMLSFDDGDKVTWNTSKKDVSI